MSPAVALRQTASASQALSLFNDTGGEPTLDDLVASVWEGLTARANVACPVCAEPMAPQYGAHSRPIGGRCTACGSTLS